MASTDSIFATRTTTKLLDALRDQSNEPVWSHINSRFRPVIAGLARRLGLNQSDAEEVAQQTLSEFVKAYREGRYHREKGRLSSWILGIAHNTTLRMIRAGRHAGGSKVGSLVAADEVADEASLRTIWDDERDRAILERAISMLREESEIDERTLLAFELVAIRGVPAAEVGQQCQMSTDQVYVAKSRVTRKLKSLVEQLTSAFEEDA